ncbi:MAG: arginyltransferase [Alphaproteobacteria bacterium]|nr:arginyltransferase [Alphaproteobacteria bacterium]
MSIIPHGLSRNLQFYLSGPLPCPYLPAQVERKLFTRLDSPDPAENAAINATLCRTGFRRSHDVVYRPACTACNACIPVRIPVKLFKPSRNLKRLAARNADLVWQRATTAPDAEMFALFSAYQQGRHADSDMAHMTDAEFAAMLQEGQADTHMYQLRDGGGALKACVIADHVGDGISAVYSFFTPDEPRRSLGTQIILSLVTEAQARDWPFLYLGYWVAESRKMSYKARFKPLQALGPQGWDWLE